MDSDLVVLWSYKEMGAKFATWRKKQRFSFAVEYRGNPVFQKVMVDKNPTSRTSCTLSLYMWKKHKTADGALRRLLVSLPRFSGADFCGERTGHFRSSSGQFWKSVRSEHKLIAWSYWSNSVFTWRHGGHIGVPKQWNGAHVGLPRKSSGSWILFLCKRFLFFQ